jgi:drug/metabolite transporter (DMT)-like permease
MIQLHLAVFLFGLSGLFGKFLNVPSTTIVLGRTLVAALTLSVVIVARRIPFPSIKIGIKLFPSGALLSLHWFTFFYAIQISSVTVGLLSFATFPMFVAFLDPFFSRKRILFSDVLSAVTVFTGLFLIIPSFDYNNHFFQGVLWGLASSVTFALLTLFNRRFVAGTDPIIVGLFQNFWAAVCMSSGLLLLCNAGIHNLFLIAVLGIVCTALAHTLFIAALKTVRPQLASITAGLEPVYGILLAFLILGESPGLREIIGGIVILSVITAYSLRDIRQSNQLEISKKT